MSAKVEECKCFAVVKVRGTISAQREARETLEMLRLSKSNHAVLVRNNPSMKGMLKRVQSYVTWGEISKEMCDNSFSATLPENYETEIIQSVAVLFRMYEQNKKNIFGKDFFKSY